MIHLNLCRNKKQTVIKTTRYDWSSFTNKDLTDKSTVTVRNKFESLQETSEIHTPNDDYENFLTAYMEAVIECVPTKPKAKCRVPWESQEARKQRDHLKSILTRKKKPNKFQCAET